MKKNLYNHSKTTLDDSLPTITIYCDGGCRGNDSSYTNNIGAYAYMLIYKQHTKLDGRAVRGTTNNKMELLAVTEALKQLNDSAYKMNIIIYSDSLYVVNGLTKWWNGWKAKEFYNVKNMEYWKPLKKLYDSFPHIQIYHIKGHSGNEGNERVDEYCNYLMDNKIF